jgi:hypothetical protein
MNQKTLAIAVVVIVVVAVVVAGVYLFMSGGGGGPTPTPTPTPTSTPSGADVAGASSLQFSVEVSGGTSAGTYTFMAKNIGTSNMMIRVEMSNSYELIDIINGAQQKAWESVNGEWTDYSANYATQFDAWDSTLTGYKTSLASWTGTTEYTYSDSEGNSVIIYGIAVNPSLADSLFEHS